MKISSSAQIRQHHSRRDKRQNGDLQNLNQPVDITKMRSRERSLFIRLESGVMLSRDEDTNEGNMKRENKNISKSFKNGFVT